MATTVLKPAGVPVFAPHADPDGACVARDLLTEQPWRATLDWPEGFDAGIAHRLDVSTSGALLVADDPDELARIREAFASGAFTKRYLFRAAKSVPWSQNACERPLAHDRKRKGRMIVQRGANTPHRGRWYPARTAFRRLEGDLWEATMSTGVMHQIRAHAAFVGIPLVGDRRYGGGATPDNAPPGTTFLLHHVGLRGAGFETVEVARPAWAGGPA